MIDTNVFYFINGLAGKVPVVDELFKGIANDYFLMITFCLILVYLWFGTRDIRERQLNQLAVLTAIVGIGIINGLIVISNLFYFRIRPFNELPNDAINLLYYRPTDSSFPSNFAAVLFSIAVVIFLKNKKYGTLLLIIALIGGFARVYVGIHYPLDILGGAATGAIAGCLAYLVIRLTKQLPVLLIQVLQKIFLA
jgi:undecaprenyl-diphosphatase